MLAPLTFIAAVLGLLAARRRRRGPRLARALIVSPHHSTVVAGDGKVHSTQSAEITVDTTHLERLWVPANLENLGRTYWRFLTRATLGLIRIVYDADSRSVVLLGRPLTLLRFAAPEYALEPDHGKITWRIRDGLLVSRFGRGSGFLAVDVRRPGEEVAPDRTQVHIEVEVANFYPSIATGFSVPVYRMTQSVVHVLITHAFLRSLANLHLDPSRVGILAERVRDAQP